MIIFAHYFKKTNIFLWYIKFDSGCHVSGQSMQEWPEYSENYIKQAYLALLPPS